VASGKFRELGPAYAGVTFSPDGARIAASLRDGLLLGPGMPEVGVWDAVTGRQVLVLKGPAANGNVLPFARGIAFSPDGHRLLSVIERTGSVILGTQESEVKVWDATPWTE
jgi:WD40 repeat protein